MLTTLKKERFEVLKNIFICSDSEKKLLRISLAKTFMFFFFIFWEEANEKYIKNVAIWALGHHDLQLWTCC